jgi:hypothetical protein
MDYILKNLLIILLYGFSIQLMALEVTPKVSENELASTSGLSSFVSVADNIKSMDTDHDGIVSVHEMRVFIESTRGEGYKKSLFDAMEASANSRSCGSAFSGSLY